jgi:hypothetical protein
MVYQRIGKVENHFTSSSKWRPAGGLNIISRHTFLSSFHHFLIWFFDGEKFLEKEGERKNRRDGHTHTHQAARLLFHMYS